MTALRMITHTVLELANQRAFYALFGRAPAVFEKSEVRLYSRYMIRSLLVTVVLCSACGSSSTDSPGAQGDAGSNGNASCPDVSGTWKVTAHCDPSLVGSSLRVTETDCALSFDAPFDAFTGSVDAAGKITLGGPQTCTGSATTSAITLNCSPGTCVVKLAR